MVAKIPFTGTFVVPGDTDDIPASGSITITPSAEVRDPDGNIILTMIGREFPLDNTGRVSGSLYATDDATVPSGWTYIVKQTFLKPSTNIAPAYQRSWNLIVPKDTVGTLDLSHTPDAQVVPLMANYATWLDLQAVQQDATNAAADAADALADSATALSGLTTTNATVAALGTTVAGKADAASVPVTALAAVTTDRRPRDRRERPARWDYATDGLTALTSTGLTTAGGGIGASVGGTNGDAILPVWGTRKDFRAGFRVTCTKATAGSRATVGFTVSAVNSLPTSGNFTFSVGYKQGTGICVVRDNVGGDVSIIADASITDGDLYDIGVLVDKTLDARGTATGTVLVRAKKVSDGTETLGGSTFNLVNFPINNILIRSNVAAGGLNNLQIANHPLGATGVNLGGVLPYSASTPTETAFLHIPATPNGKLVLALHGHGGTPMETGWSSAVYTATWAALVAAGFTVAVPNMGGNLWGNDTAIGYVVDLYNQLIASYDLDPNVFIWGNSMGGGATARIVSDRPFPIRAAYLAEPALDYTSIWSNPSFPTMATAYGNDTAARDAANPLLRAGSSYAGVPLMIVASTSDTTIAKGTNADALATLASPYTSVTAVSGTGNHQDPSMFKARATLDWFRLAQ